MTLFLYLAHDYSLFLTSLLLLLLSFLVRAFFTVIIVILREHIILDLLNLELHIEELPDVLEHRDRLLSDPPYLDGAQVVSCRQRHQHKHKRLIGRVDHRAGVDLVEEAEGHALAQVLRQLEIVRVEVVVLR